MTRRRRLDDIHVVLDDNTVERLRNAADGNGIELEELIVHLIHAASCRVDEFFVHASEGP